MSGGLTKHEILQQIDSGKFIFRPTDSKNKNEVIDFQAVVNVIHQLEKNFFIKVMEYHPSKFFPQNTPKLFDQVTVENLTVEGEVELNRMNDLHEP
jgi:hypothetical protein